jgi:hypothetical protein
VLLAAVRPGKNLLFFFVLVTLAGITGYYVIPV